MADFPMYRVLMQHRVRLLLEALKRKLLTSKSEQMQLKEKLTIEHLMPQRWRKHWSLPIEPESELAEQERDRLLHTVGNLTLLTGKLNPAIPNAPWKNKHPEITTHGLLRLNIDLGKYPVRDES